MWFMRGTEIVGVLCDWDLAEDRSEGDHRAIHVGPSDVTPPPDEGRGKALPLPWGQRSVGKQSGQQNEHAAATSETQVRPCYRTGTGPFMALDLLDECHDPPPHRYRYDLESFFYVYACSAVTYDPDSEQKLGVIPQWDMDTATVFNNKRTFLTVHGQFEKVFQSVHAEFKGVVETSLRQLWRLFGDVQDIATFRQIAKRKALARGSETAEQCREMDEDAERERDALATYENFMDALGEPSGTR